MRSYVGEIENNGPLLLSSFNTLSIEGARRWPPQPRPAAIRQRPSPPPLCSRSRWECTHGSVAARRGQRNGPASDQSRPAMAIGDWEARRRAKRRLGVPAEAWGVRCDAAGRDGLWRPRFCVSQGGAHRGEPPRPAGEDGSPGGAPAAHDAESVQRIGIRCKVEGEMTHVFPDSPVLRHHLPCHEGL